MIQQFHTPGIYPKELKADNQADTYTPMYNS